MKYVGKFNSMEDGKYYFVYFPMIFGIEGRQCHVIKRVSSSIDNSEVVGCINYLYYTNREDDRDLVDPSMCGVDARFGDRFASGHYYELDDTEILTYVVPEIL